MTVGSRHRAWVAAVRAVPRSCSERAAVILGIRPRISVGRERRKSSLAQLVLGVSLATHPGLAQPGQQSRADAASATGDAPTSDERAVGTEIDQPAEASTPAADTPQAPPQSGPPSSASAVQGDATSAEQTTSAEPKASLQVLTLEQCLTLAQRSNPSVAQIRAQVAQVKAQLREVKTTPFGMFSTNAGLALAPTVGGTSVFSQDTDISLSDNMGLAWQVNLSGTVPLWTFGKLSHAKEAAGAQVEAKEHEVFKARNELKQSVRHAYYGILFARDALALLEEATSRIDKYMSKLEQKVEDEEADETALFEMKMYRTELAARRSEIVYQQSIARAGLRTLIGKGGGWDVVDAPLPTPDGELAPLSRYLDAARLNRPELNMARAGVKAREAQVEMERARLYPDLGLTLNAGWSQAPEVTDQFNPFVRDPANYLRYGAAIGLKWDLDFLPQLARKEQAEAKLEEMLATEKYALGGVGLEVEKAYYEARGAGERLALYAESAEWARRWMITVQQGIDIGVYEGEDLVKPAKEYAMRRFSEISATFDYNMALGRLALATGSDDLVTH